MRKKENIVNPVGLKGHEKMDHIIGLMGKLNNITENVKTIPSVSISKKAQMVMFTLLLGKTLIILLR